MKNILICVLGVSMLCACGIKPKNVKPPAGSTNIYGTPYPQQTVEDPN